MKIDEMIQTDIAVAMKDREEHRLTTLQMMKLNTEGQGDREARGVDGCGRDADSDDADQAAGELVEAFTKGGRPELAEKERLEIEIFGARLFICTRRLVGEGGAEGFGDLCKWLNSGFGLPAFGEGRRRLLEQTAERG